MAELWRNLTSSCGNPLPSIYRYAIGDIEVTAIHEGTRSIPLNKNFIPNAPFADVQSTLAAAFLPTDHLNITFTPLFVKVGASLAVFDPGFADNGPKNLGNFYRNLPVAGMDPKEVEVVIISHFHGDHISGLRLKDGTDAYPKARVMVPAAEWEYWMNDDHMGNAPEALRGNFALVRKVFDPLKDRVGCFKGGAEILPGITAIDSPGHTPGHTSFLVISGDARLFITSDITNHPALFVRRPDWSPAFDMDLELARQSRRRLLEWAAKERIQVAMFHAPFPATGFIAADGDGFSFVAAQWSPVA